MARLWLVLWISLVLILGASAVSPLARAADPMMKIVELVEDSIPIRKALRDAREGADRKLEISKWLIIKLEKLTEPERKKVLKLIKALNAEHKHQRGLELTESQIKRLFDALTPKSIKVVKIKKDKSTPTTELELHALEAVEDSLDSVEPSTSLDSEVIEALEPESIEVAQATDGILEVVELDDGDDISLEPLSIGDITEVKQEALNSNSALTKNAAEMLAQFSDWSILPGALDEKTGKIPVKGFQAISLTPDGTEWRLRLMENGTYELRATQKSLTAYEVLTKRMKKVYASEDRALGNRIRKVLHNEEGSLFSFFDTFQYKTTQPVESLDRAGYIDMTFLKDQAGIEFLKRIHTEEKTKSCSDQLKSVK